MLYGFVFSKNVDTSDMLKIFFLLVESFESCQDNARSCKLFSWNKESNFRNTVTDVFFRISPLVFLQAYSFNVAGFKPFNAELKPICHLLALLGAHHILHVSRIRVKHEVQKTKTCGDVPMARRLTPALAQLSCQFVAVSLCQDGHSLLPLL
jgi:hypothetical protein